MRKTDGIRLENLFYLIIFLFLRSILTQVGVIILELSTPVKFLLGQFTRAVIMIRLCHGETIDGADDARRALRSTVLRAAPVSFRSRRKISIVEKSVVVQLIATVRRRDVANVLVGLLGWVESSFDVAHLHDVVYRKKEKKNISKMFEFLLIQVKLNNKKFRGKVFI